METRNWYVAADYSRQTEEEARQEQEVSSATRSLVKAGRVLNGMSNQYSRPLLETLQLVKAASNLSDLSPQEKVEMIVSLR